MEFKANPKFLGVTMDKTLSFQQHVDAVVKTVEARCKATAVLGASDFGWMTEQLRKVFLATQKSVMDYAGPGWQPWLSSTQMDRLDRAQNKCSTPIEAVHLEANVQSYQTTSRRLTAISWEKAKRAPKNHPREVASRPGPPHRLARSNWREQAKRTADQLPEELEKREVLSVEAPPLG